MESPCFNAASASILRRLLRSNGFTRRYLRPPFFSSLGLSLFSLVRLLCCPFDIFFPDAMVYFLFFFSYYIFYVFIENRINFAILIYINTESFFPHALFSRSLYEFRKFIAFLLKSNTQSCKRFLCLS